MRRLALIAPPPLCGLSLLLSLSSSSLPSSSLLFFLCRLAGLEPSSLLSAFLVLFVTLALCSLAGGFVDEASCCGSLSSEALRLGPERRVSFVMDLSFSFLASLSSLLISLVW